MTCRVSYAPQDFQKMCNQAERDHESKKLVVLLDRVKKQIAARQPLSVESPKPPNGVVTLDANLSKPLSRSALFER